MIDQFSVTRSTASRPPTQARRSPRRRLIDLATVALAALVLDAAPGAAQPSLAGAAAAKAQARAKSKAQANPKPEVAAKTAAPSGPILAVVSIAQQRVLVYGRTGLLAQSPVSTGMAGHRTPTGVFSILQRSRHHRSNIYSNAPMPYMQRLTWSGIALHGGVLPGYPASHGCIRLPHAFAVELWGMTRLGTRVVVAPDNASALPIAHARLPAPRLTPALVEDGGQHEATGSNAYGHALASAAGVRVADAEDALGPASVPLLDPLQRARAAQASAAADASEKAKAAKLAIKTAAANAADARSALDALGRDERAFAAAQRRRDWAARAAATARGPLAAERAHSALAAAEEHLDAARGAADEARLVEAALSKQAFEAAAGAAEAEDAHHAAAEALKVAERTLEPISIFVSRKAERVYIRQAWTPVHEAPVRFVDNGAPVGTHVYQAMGSAAEGAALRWLSVSLPSSSPSRGRARRGEPAPAAAGLAQETAATALARFELPEETRRFIADRLWAGATLIVSDHRPSGETGVGTDFIVLTR
jgi:hypothetical protein